MKILHLSDLHLEFGEIAPPETDADVVVLSGDIDIGSKGIEWASKFNRNVVVILGNHEAYIQKSLEELIVECREKAAKHPLVHFLENESVVIGDVRFHGSTLWTDFELDKNSVLSMHYARNAMSDFKKITYFGQPFSPEISAEIHRKSRSWLFESVKNSRERKNVVVTHHLPTSEAIQDVFRNSVLNPAFASNCNEFSELSEKISLWLYGHNHDCREFIHEGIRYSTNQRGYEGIEMVNGFSLTKTIDF
ncbi:metallophosphoesterase [Vibrio fluvialis]|nr:metallophosphoesterase [Vibrio fluvialis]